MLQTQSTQAQTTSAEETLERAHLLFLRGQYEDARHLVESVLTTQPGNLPARRLLDDIHVKTMPALPIAQQTQQSALHLNLKFGFRALLGGIGIIVCTWRLFENIQYAFANGLGAAITVTSHRGTSHYPVWFWIFIMGGSIGFIVRFLYFSWLEREED